MSSQPSTSALPPAPAPWTPENFEALTPEGLAQYRLKSTPTTENSSGKVVKLQDGDIFYSPNCYRDLREAEYMGGGMQRDPSTAKLSEFLKPRWWAGSDTTYLAFLPLILNTAMPPFHVLNRDPVIRHHHARGVFFLDAKVVLQANSLEAQLRQVTNQIGGYFKVPAQSPLSPTVVCCTGDFASRKEAQKAFGQTRDWFVMWAGLLSFNIAVASLATGDTLHDNSMPSWWLHLQKNEIHPQDFLSAIHSTDLGCFEGDHRVGVIISVLGAPPDQPSPDFFCRFNVPVWYPWGVAVMAASLNDENLRRWAPPVEQLQAVATFFVTDLGSNDPEPWKAWFDRCRQALAQRKRVETRAQRIKRENRERKPPTTKVKVFVWRRVSNVVQRFPAGSDYKLQAFGKHQKVYNSLANEWDCSTLFGDLEPDEERLLRYSEVLIPEQHLRTGASDLAAGYADLEQEMADYADFLSAPPSLDPEQESAPASLIPEQESAPALLVPEQDEPGDAVDNQANIGMDREQGEIEVPLPIVKDSIFEQNINREYDWEGYEVVDLLHMFFGFCPPSNIPSNLPSSNTIPARMTKEVGAIDDSAFPQSSAAPHVAFFWKSISGPTAPNVDPQYWDLDPRNTALSTSTRIPHFKQFQVPMPFRRRPEQRPAKAAPAHGVPPKKKRKLDIDPPKVAPEKTEEKIWVLDHAEQSTTPWQLAVFSVVDMMMICRLPEELREVDILQELVNRGIRCQTLLPHQGVLPSLPPPIVAPPIRSGQYTFTDKDWDSYEAQARALLQNPRIARAALLAGGITWRIALLFRTSIANAVHGQDTSLTRAFAYPSGHRFDGLHPQEADVLSGLYLCYTASPHPDKISIFPLPDTWRSNVTPSFWTPEHERMFQVWISGINDLQQPKPQKEWVTKIRSSSSVRRAYRTITQKSEQLLSR